MLQSWAGTILTN